MKTNYNYRQAIETQHENLFRDLLEIQVRLKNSQSKSSCYESEIDQVVRSIDKLIDRMFCE